MDPPERGPNLQVISRVRGLNRRGIAFSGQTPYFGWRFFLSKRDPGSRPMRVVTVLGVLAVGAVGTVRAQHAHQLEFGGYGTFTRYDKAFQLDNYFGGGGRIGFFLNDVFGIEVDANIAYPLLTNR